MIDTKLIRDLENILEKNSENAFLEFMLCITIGGLKTSVHFQKYMMCVIRPSLVDISTKIKELI